VGGPYKLLANIALNDIGDAAEPKRPDGRITNEATKHSQRRSPMKFLV